MKQFNKNHLRLIALITAGTLLLGTVGYLLVAHFSEPPDSEKELNQIVSTKGAAVDFGLLLDEDDVVTIEKVVPAAVDPDVEIYAYDFNLSSGQPDGVIEVAISYSDKGLKEDEEKVSVCGKYLNEDSGEWEDVFYTVDPDSNTVRILTDHLSTYAVFKITNASKRSAYISEVNVYAANMTTSQAAKILEVYSGQAPTWREDVVSATMEALGSHEYFVASSVPTLLSLGGAYDSIISSSLGDSLTLLGVSTACAQFAYDAYNYGLDSKEASFSGMKAVLNLSVSLANAPIQLAYVGVGVIDLALTDVSTFAVSNKYKSTKNMYDAYYRRSGIKRNSIDWFKLFEKMYKDNKNEPEKVLQLMQAEIDRYVQEYWTEAATDWESWIDAYDKNGKLSKYPWPLEKDRNNIANIHKSELYDYLGNVFRRISQNMYLDSLIEREKDFQKLADIYNRKFSLVIREDVPSGKSPTWAGYYARLAPISKNADSSSWIGKLNENGGGRMSFTLLAHQTAGFPMNLELYKTAADVREGKNKLKTITLNPFTEPEQTVLVQPRQVDVTEPEEPEPEPKPEPKPPIAEENPWYDVTVKALDNSKVFSGWSAVLQYPKDSFPDLQVMLAEFDRKGQCLLSFQRSDYEGLESPSQIWLYINKADLLKKAKPDQVVNFSLASASYAGEYSGEPLYKLIVKAKPPEDKPDILEGITGDYASYLLHSEYFTTGLPEKIVKDYAPGEEPSADVNLHYNGPSLTYISAADPYHTGKVLEKSSDSLYERTETDDSSTTYIRVEIISTGSSARLFMSYDSPGTTWQYEYMLTRK